VVDLGSGAGLPGLILAILRPELQVHLVESDARKSAFLREAARETGATPVIHNIRIEALEPFPCDTVTARALAPLAKLLELSAPFAPGQGLFLKGEEAERELTESTGQWMMAVERIPSRSDPRGVVPRLSEIARASHIRHSQPEGRGR
jgi:16S rRNA (guanine527-N7)-methyltransferase